MDRLGGSGEAAGGRRPEETLTEAGRRVGNWVKQVIAAFVILAIFAGLMYLRLAGQLGDAGILVYSGVILGYLLHSTKDVI